MKRMRLLVGIVVGSAVLGLAGPASAATSGTQDWRITFDGPLSTANAGGPTGRTVITHGLVNSMGYEDNVSQQPGSSPGTFVGGSDFVFPVGSYTVHVDGVIDNIRTFGPNSCYLLIDVSGTYDVVSGTGAFAGATGGGTFSGRNIVLQTPTDDGCSPDGATLVSHLRGSGSMTLTGAQAA